MSSLSGQLSPDDRKRSTTARTVDGAIPNRRATSRPATSPENVRRRISRTWRIGTLSVGIRHLLRTVQREVTLRRCQQRPIHPVVVGDIISERWATSFRNGGRDHFGTVGGFARIPQSKFTL